MNFREVKIPKDAFRRKENLRKNSRRFPHRKCRSGEEPGGQIALAGIRQDYDNRLTGELRTL